MARELTRLPWVVTPDSETRLRRLLEDRYGADEAVLTGSGTQALQLALEVARRATGRDTVLFPGFTCFDLVTAAVGAGVRARFYDLDPTTLLPERSSLDRERGGAPAGVVLVHHFAVPTPPDVMEPLIGPGADSWATAAGPLLIEDAAQGQGGELSGRPLGALAPLSVLSFGRGKGWTGGGGGALLLRGEVARHAAGARAGLAPPASVRPAAAKLAAQWLMGRPSLYGVPAALPWVGLGETVYHPPVPCARMHPGVARLVLDHDDAARAEAARRVQNAERLVPELERLQGLRTVPARGRPGWLRLPARVPGRSAAELLGEDARRLGILPSYPRPLNELEVLAGRGTATPPLPGAAILAAELFTLPTHRWVGDREIQGIVAALAAAI